jgi:hypothetical protein
MIYLGKKWRRFYEKWGRFGKKYGRNDLRHYYQKLLIKKIVKIITIYYGFSYSVTSKSCEI